METAHEQSAAKSRQLIPIVDDIFEVYEQVHRYADRHPPLKQANRTKEYAIFLF